MAEDDVDAQAQRLELLEVAQGVADHVFERCLSLDDTFGHYVVICHGGVEDVPCAANIVAQGEKPPQVALLLLLRGPIERSAVVGGVIRLAAALRAEAVVLGEDGAEVVPAVPSSGRANVTCMRSVGSGGLADGRRTRSWPPSRRR